MAMRYGYFDSEVTGVDENGMPIFDRAETSDLFRILFAKLVSSGVLASPGDCFQVVAGTGMTVRIRPGFAMINGAFAYDAGETTVTLAAANTSLPRLDRVVLRCNYLDRRCEIIVKTGTPATTPTAPELLKPENGDYYELGLALIAVAANQTAITQSSISDTRADSRVCGFITQLIDHIDTSVFMQQLTSWMTEYEAQCQDSFGEWFNEMKNQLSEDAAGNLQLEIDNLMQSINSNSGNITNLSDDLEQLKNDTIGSTPMETAAHTVTAAINELLTKISALETKLSGIVRTSSFTVAQGVVDTKLLAPVATYVLIVDTAHPTDAMKGMYLIGVAGNKQISIKAVSGASSVAVYDAGNCYLQIHNKGKANLRCTLITTYRG